MSEPQPIQSKSILQNLDPYDTFRPHITAEIDDTRTWVDPKGYRLSDRLWRAGSYDRAMIEANLKKSLAKGVSPLQAARYVEKFLNPDYQLRRDPETFKVLPLAKQPPGVATLRPRQGPGKGVARPRNSGLGSYAARRLARTETTRAFGAATLAAAKASPLLERIKWALSGHHDEPDQCNINARKSSANQPPGVYLVDEVPRFPDHPHEMCTLQPYVTKNTIANAIPRLREFIRTGNLPDRKWIPPADDPSLTTLFGGGIPIDAPEPTPLGESGYSRMDIDSYNRNKDDAYMTGMQGAGFVDHTYRLAPEWMGGSRGGRYTDAEQQALSSYKGSGYVFTNRYLRRGPDSVSDSNAATSRTMIANIDSAFAKADPITQPIRVTRGQYRDVMDLPNQQVGNLYVDDGYLSTTVVPEGVGFGRGITMEIYAPPGTKVIPLDSMSNGSATGEAELLFPRGTTMMIREIDLSTNRVKLEVLP